MDGLQSYNRLMTAVVGVVKERGGDSFLVNSPSVATLYEMYVRYASEVVEDLKRTQVSSAALLALEKKLQKIPPPTGRSYGDMVAFVKAMTKAFGKTKWRVCCNKQSRSAWS